MDDVYVHVGRGKDLTDTSGQDQWGTYSFLKDGA